MPRSSVVVVLDDESVQQLLVVALVGGEELVGDAFVPPSDVTADQALAAALGRALVPQQVRVGGQQGQWTGPADHQVGVQEKQVVGFGVRTPDVQAPVVAEVHPGVLVEFARDAVECGTDQPLGSIGRAGIGDHPGVHQTADGSEAALDDACLVLDDHAQADGRLHGNTNPRQVGPRDVRETAREGGGGTPESGTEVTAARVSHGIAARHPDSHAVAAADRTNQVDRALFHADSRPSEG